MTKLKRGTGGRASSVSQITGHESPVADFRAATQNVYGAALSSRGAIRADIFSTSRFAPTNSGGVPGDFESDIARVDGHPVARIQRPKPPAPGLAPAAARAPCGRFARSMRSTNRASIVSSRSL